ncbi:MAG: ATP-dependent zinc metalloprotease FtsH [bacterium]
MSKKKGSFDRFKILGNKKKTPNPFWGLLLLLGLALGVLFYYNAVNKDLLLIKYSAFLNLVESDDISEVYIRDQHVQGKLKSGKGFETYIVPTDSLWPELRKHKVDIKIFPQEAQSWGAYLLLSFLPLLLLLAFVFFRQSQGGPGGASKIFNVGKSKAKFFSPNTVNVYFKDVAGVEEAKEDLGEIVEFLKNPKKFARLGAKVPKGILLSGAPGTGKTLLAKAVAGEANCPFFSISGSDFVEVFVGVGAARVRDLFDQAKKYAPCIVFIDEIDAVGRQRGIGLGGGNDEREQTLNQLLSEMDGFTTEHGQVIVLAATNRPDVLDKALLRPGRFDRIIEVPYPDVKSREKILEVHVKNVKLDSDVNLKKIAQGTPGFSGADLENLINEAALLASKSNKDSVDIDCFEKARDKLILGSERKSLVLSEKDKLKLAYHESGHTLLNVLLPDTDPFHKVTIIPRGSSLGVSWSLPEGDRVSVSKAELLSQIKVLLGGLLAENMKFGEHTSGASNDIERATKLARLMVSRYGMSDELGPIMYDETKEHPYLGRDIQQARQHSEGTAQKVDDEVEKVVKTCYLQAEKLLNDNREKLDLLAQKLLEKEILHSEEVYELLNLPPVKSNSLK